MKLFKTVLQRLLYPACLIFTASVFLFTGITAAVEKATMGPNIRSLAFLLMFSLCIAAMNNIFRTRLAAPLKLVLHYCGTFVSFVLIFILFAGNIVRASQSLIICIIFTVLYFMAAGVIFLVLYLVKAKRNDKTAYKSQFEIPPAPDPTAKKRK